MSSSSQQVVIVGREPAPRRRLDENKPEERRSLILAALEASAATIEHADPTEVRVRVRAWVRVRVGKPYAASMLDGLDGQP